MMQRGIFREVAVCFFFIHVVAAPERSPAQTTGRYGRMFPAAPPPSHEYLEKLRALGCALLADGAAKRFNNCSRSTQPAGYTYFGQLIDHDLTFDATSIEEMGGMSPEEIENRRTPWLDLDQVYCGGPSKSPQLYCGDKGAECFRIEGKSDLPKGDIYKLIGDQSLPLGKRDFRDLENAILLQMHVLFMRLHNLAIEQNFGCGIPELDEFDDTPFKRAARLVRWQYQYLVRKDFLRVLTDPGILSRVQSCGPKFQWEPGKFFIPVEFSTAAFRFGHSAVRDKYRVNSDSSLFLRDLVELKLATEALCPTMIVDWKNFFYVKTTPIPMQAIDTWIASDLGNLSRYTVQLFSAAPLLNLKHGNEGTPLGALPVRSLIRGALMRIPSGQKVACELGLKERKLTDDQLIGTWATEHHGPDKSGKELQEQRLVDETPLFYYILREAEIAACANHLGPLGSQIVADVIEGSFRFDPDSDWEIRSRWTPPEWKSRSGRIQRITEMKHLIQLFED
jgi:hypothetical protein